MQKSKARPVKEEVIELRLASFIETDNFSLEHCLPWYGDISPLSRSVNELKG
jgi:hypothetical protein